jgi:octaprenyl-diphosphate synthase
MMTLQLAMQAVENVMFDVVNSDVVTLRDASRHILNAGGKRVRPRLLFLSFFATGGQDFSSTVPVAAAVELVHTASVVHDDINDHGVMRRGRPSVNAIWGRTFALLTGDFLFTKVYELMAPYKDLNILLSEATVALVEGETMQAAAAKEGKFTRQVYYDIIARKTAALFKAAGSMGATLAGAPQEHIEALGQYGFNVGLAFQIIDDILDITADAEKLGKTSGIDLVQGRGIGTLYTNGQNGGVAVAEQVAVAEADPMAKIKQKILEGNALNEAREQAQMLSMMAINSLEVIPDSEAKQELIELAHLVVNRDH